MHVHEWGRREDVPLVFLHEQPAVPLGVTAKTIARAGFRVVSIDGPLFVEQLDELLDERGLDRPVLAGHGDSGCIGAAYAATHPLDVRALILFDCGQLEPDDDIPVLRYDGRWPPDGPLGDDIAAWLVEQGL